MKEKLIVAGIIGVVLTILGYTNHFGFSFWLLVNPTPPGFQESQQRQGLITPERRASEGAPQRSTPPASGMDRERAALLVATPREVACTFPWFIGRKSEPAYYVDPQDDRLRCFDRPGHNPYNGNTLQAIDKEFVREIEAAQASGVPTPACGGEGCYIESFVKVPVR